VSLARVAHRAFVDVNEEGTEATAVTGFLGDLPGRVPVDIQADRPFRFLIRDVEHGTILFMGRLTDPKG
jgi:serpin B